MENIAPFYIGQKIVRIGYSTPIVKKGLIYTVADCFKCKCGAWKVTVLEYPYTGDIIFKCDSCGKAIKHVFHFGGAAENFAPVHENFQSISLTKVLEEETKLIGVN